MDKEQYIKENYTKIPTKQIAEYLGIKIATVKRLANKIGVGSFSPETELLVPEILDKYYKKKLTVKTITSQVCLSKPTVLAILKKYGVGGRTRSEMNITYSCDIDYFTKIDTPEKAYWFGFITADGNLSEGKVRVCLHKKDFSLLEKFKKALKYKGKFYFHKKSPMVELSIRRKKLYESLKSLGLTENKTLKIDETIFDCIPENLKMAAIHGYFDGDGCFTKPKTKNAITLGLVGNERFLLFVRERLDRLNLISGSCNVVKDKRTKQTYFMNLYLTGEYLKRLYFHFYESEFSSRYFLDRKRKRAYDAMSYVTP